MPAPGAGRFCLLLHGLGYRFVPAGVYEEDGALCLHFGPEYSLDLPPGLSPDEKDAVASRQVMSHIALLPRFRGEFYNGYPHLSLRAAISPSENLLLM